MRLPSSYSPWNEAALADYESLSPIDARRLAEEFGRRDGERMQALLNLVRLTPGFESTTLQSPREWLARLGAWVLVTVTTTKHPPGSILVRDASSDRAHQDLTDLFKHIPLVAVDDEFVPVGLDCGLALGRCIRDRFPSLKWKRCSPPSYHIYNHPILPFKGNVGYSAVEKGAIILDAISKKRVASDFIATQYDSWCELFSEAHGSAD